MGEAFLMKRGGAASIRAELLWENNNPSDAFEARDVELDLSNYDMIRIEFYAVNNAHRIHSVELRNIPGSITDLLWYSAYSNTYYGRVVTIQNNGISFASALKASNTTDTTHCIPFRIYGIIWSDMRDE